MGDSVYRPIPPTGGLAPSHPECYPSDQGGTARALLCGRGRTSGEHLFPGSLCELAGWGEGGLSRKMDLWGAPEASALDLRGPPLLSHWP